MAISISYKNERILKWRSAILSVLSEKMLFFADQKEIDPNSNIVQFIENWEYSCGGNIDDLNSREEVQQLSELIELAVNSLIKENYYKYYDYEKDGKILNQVFEDSQHFIKRTKTIAANEWTDENLFIRRAYNLKPLTNTLLYWARKKKLDPNLRLMKFLKSLPREQLFQDIDIRSKEELEQFIELLELSIKTLIDDDFFFESEEYYFLNYLQRLKEVAADWDNAISDEWKQGKLVTEIKSKPKPEIEPIVDQLLLPKSTIKDFIKLIAYAFLMIIIILVILWLITLIAKFLQRV